MLLQKRVLKKDDLEAMRLPECLWYAKAQGVPESVRDTVIDYLKNFDNRFSIGAGLLILGNQGVGKSSIAALVAKEARSRGYSVLYIQMGTYREMIRGRTMYGYDSTVSSRARGVDVLVIDDITEYDAKEKLFGIHELTEMIKTRASHKKLTIAVAPEFSPIGSTLSGIAEVGKGVMVPLMVYGEDLREKKHFELEKMVLVGRK